MSSIRKEQNNIDIIRVLVANMEKQNDFICVDFDYSRQIWSRKYLKKKIFGKISNDNSHVNYMFVDPSMNSLRGCETGSVIISIEQNNHKKLKYINLKYINSEITSSASSVVDYVIKDIIKFFEVYPETKIILFVESNTFNHGEDILKELHEHNWINDDRVIFIKGINIRKGSKVNLHTDNQSLKRYGITKRGGHEEVYVQ